MPVKIMGVTTATPIFNKVVGQVLEHASDGAEGDVFKDVFRINEVERTAGPGPGLRLACIPHDQAGDVEAHGPSIILLKKGGETPVFMAVEHSEP
jgi:hypothetical protein